MEGGGDRGTLFFEWYAYNNYMIKSEMLQVDAKNTQAQFLRHGAEEGENTAKATP